MVRMSMLWGILLLSGPLQAQTRTWYFMPTGNGHGFQVFDRTQGKITRFLEHPYRYVAPGDDGRTWGIGRRNLAHDVYLGLRFGGTSAWLDNLQNVEYEQQTHIIHAATSQSGAAVDVYAFAPFGLSANSLLLLVRVQNTTASAQDLSVFAKPNLKLGTGRTEPNDANEQIGWDPATSSGTETGPGGGHVLVFPIGGVSHASCGTDSAIYNAVLGGGSIGDTHACSGNSQVLALQQDARLEPGAALWWGMAVLFVNDNPSDPRADLFKDSRTPADLRALWNTFATGKSAQTLHDEALQEFEAYRKATAPAGLSATEQKLWRQSEAILRMGQILERPGKNHGMILASLPTGEWHTGWVRDAAYAIAAFAMTGHLEQARQGVEFFLGGESGFFAGANYLNRAYRVSVCRYFGDGLEEGDFNDQGPNIETDGWGLVLWAAGMVMQYSCDLDWLDKATWKGDTVFEALHQIAQDIEATIQSNLPRGDASIWEVHWNYRQVFAYTTAAQIRGLFDFAAIAKAYGRTDLADHYRGLAQDMLDTARSALVRSTTSSFVSHLGVAGSDVYVDGSTVGFMDWRLVDATDGIAQGTLSQYSKLVTGFGGYRRLEPALSLTGGGSAGTYDLSEWILLDLRIGDVWRRAGNASRADDLLGKVTAHAEKNDFLIPELYDPDNGRYTGVVPMVGYGAGAWMMSQLEKHGYPAPGPGAELDCQSDPCDPNPCAAPHKSVCTAEGSAAICSCDPGYAPEPGGDCQPVTACFPDNPCTTVHQTRCVVDGPGFVCECDEGYAMGLDDECQPITPCWPDNPCESEHLPAELRSVCVVEGTGHRCDCNPGTSDVDGVCTLPEECDPAVTCSNHGSCTGNGFECACDPGYTGTNCELCDTGYHLKDGACVANTPCDPNPCKTIHKTQCSESEGSSICQCDPGYQDEDGDGTCKPDCLTAGLDCGAHGACAILDGEAGCSCDPGYQGASCGACAPGYHDQGGQCLPDSDGGIDGGPDGGGGSDLDDPRDDGPATLCSGIAGGLGLGWLVLLGAGIGSLAIVRRRSRRHG